MTVKPNILAIYPEVAESKIFDRMPPLGMLWIAAVLRDAGYRFRFVNEQVEEPDVAALADELEPALTLVGGTSHSRFDAFDRAARVKEGYPPTTVVYGGPHAAFTAEDTLTYVPDIDIVVHGEGERTAVYLARWKDSGGGTPGLYNIKSDFVQVRRARRLDRMGPLQSQSGRSTRAGPGIGTDGPLRDGTRIFGPSGDVHSHGPRVSGSVLLLFLVEDVRPVVRDPLAGQGRRRNRRFSRKIRYRGNKNLRQHIYA
jgi:hypothetical protein